MFRGPRSTPPLRVSLLVCFALAAALFAETPSRAEGADSSVTREPGFAAMISGAYQGEVSGAGVLQLLPDAGFDRRGYFFLADGRGIRPHGVTFILPRGTVPGRHVLESPSPLTLGTVPSVRVDRDTGDAAVSADRNTAGYLELLSFPDDEARLSGSQLAGKFAFETEDRTGKRIAVVGSFSFTVP